MTIRFKIGLDRLSGRIVHIDEVPEGYTEGVCPDCGQRLVASNRLRGGERRIDTYFRHHAATKCAGESLPHLWAKQVIAECMELVTAEWDFTYSLTDNAGEVHYGESHQQQKVLTADTHNFQLILPALAYKQCCFA